MTQKSVPQIIADAILQFKVESITVPGELASLLSCGFWEDGKEINEKQKSLQDDIKPEDQHDYSQVGKWLDFKKKRLIRVVPHDKVQYFVDGFNSHGKYYEFYHAANDNHEQAEKDYATWMDEHGAEVTEWRFPETTCIPCETIEHFVSELPEVQVVRIKQHQFGDAYGSLLLQDAEHTYLLVNDYDISYPDLAPGMEPMAFVCLIRDDSTVIFMGFAYSVVRNQVEMYEHREAQFDMPLVGNWYNNFGGKRGFRFSKGQVSIRTNMTVWEALPAKQRQSEKYKNNLSFPRMDIRCYNKIKTPKTNA